MTTAKVLIVDDEKDFASTLAERLNLRDMEAVAVFCAEDALTLIHTQEDPPEVILLDLRMPNIDGIQALNAIKHFNPAIEVIMLTGHGESKDLIDSDAIFDYVMKPVDLSELVVKINQAAQKSRANRSSAGGSQ